MTADIAKRERVWLTFDDGPDDEWTPRILELLAQYDLTATFFVIGRHALHRPYLVRRIVDAGHDVGNHSFSHRHPWASSERAAREELRSGGAVIEDITGLAARWYRPPHGRLRRCLREEAEAVGQTVVLWTLSAVDWGPFGAARRIAARLARVRDGDVVLMHDGRGQHNRPADLAEALPSLLQRLKAADPNSAERQALRAQQLLE